MNELNLILSKEESGERISPDEALCIFEHAHLLDLARWAKKARFAHHPQNIATFTIDRNINYTNVCTSKCKFCAFYREKESKDAFVLRPEEIFKKIDKAMALGATQIMLQGGLNPDLGLGYFVGLLAGIKAKYDITIHSFSPPEIFHLAKISDLTVLDVLMELKEAGLDSLPGGGAEILVDRVRNEISPHKIGAKDWLSVMDAAHEAGLKATATMMMGSLETTKERIEHLKVVRDLQDKTGVFRAFIPWTFQPGKTELGGATTTGAEYLRFLAISRIFLDNFDHIQGSWVTQGKDIGALCLHFGADDLGSIMIEENVVAATGVSHKISESEMVELIKSSGFVPGKRDTEYNILKVY